jgi:hypothetical protein
MQMRDLMTLPPIDRRTALRRLVSVVGGALVPVPLLACRRSADEREEALASLPATETVPLEPGISEDRVRLHSWIETLRREGFGADDIGAAAARVGELAAGTPYEGFTLEEYIRAGGSPIRSEPLTLSLTRFDCVSLVESCLAIARIAVRDIPPTWEAFAGEMERMRYRGGVRIGYASRLHYFSDWLIDNERRGLVRLIGEELGGIADERPLRFMSRNPDAYPALAYPEVRAEIAEVERSLDRHTRWVLPTARISAVGNRLRTGDIVAFATSIEGLDVSHAAFAYRDGADVLRVLHAPLSGGVVEVTRATLTEYVTAIRQATGILVARPLAG